MSKDIVPLPHARSWRDIPQQVKPRAMSPEGRRRFTVRGLRLVCGLLTLGVAGWAGWEVCQALQRGPKGLDADAGLPIGSHIVAVTDGVLDKAWLVRTLALPRGATLMEIDPAQLQARILASGQVASAAILRHFPQVLEVHLVERFPVARVQAQKGTAAPQTFFVARDGVVYVGAGYDPAMVKTLPWLDGVQLVPRGPGFAPIPGMVSVAELLTRAKLEDAPLYATWHVVSLARLAADGEIEIRTASGLKITFGTRDDFFAQLARLDYLLDLAARHSPPAALQSINLALGSRVPVTLATVPVPGAAPAPAAQPASAAVPAPRIPFPFSREL